MKKSFACILTWTLCVAICGCETMQGMGKGEKEEPVAMDQLPAAVKATLMKEAGSGKIEEIEKQSRDGKTEYEADVMIDGKKWEICVREDGQLLKKKLDEEQDHEDEHEDRK